MIERAIEPRVRIEEVTIPPIRAHRLAERHLDQPRPGMASANASEIYALSIRGWVIGSEQPVTAFELVHRGLVLETVPAIPSPEHERLARIELAVSSLDLPYDFVVAVRAVLQDGKGARVATLAGTRAALPAGPTHGPSPVLITTIGRSGSTAVSNLLCHHPAFVGYRTWDTEARMVTYWAAVLRGLARPASYERQLQQPLGPGAENWWIGEPSHPNLPHDEPALPGLGREAVEALATFCRSQIGLVATSLAAAAGKPDARYYVEKAQPDIARSAAETSAELDPRTREIMLVRDFRDTVCSMRAYGIKTGVVGFGPPDDRSMAAAIRWLSEISAKAMVDYVERRDAGAHLLRYEDLINRPEATLTRVLEYIGADARPQTVALMLERLAAEREHRERHATTDSAQDSLGRWRRELDADEQELAESLLRPYLDAFGYE